MNFDHWFSVINRVSDEVNQEVGSFSYEQLNWKSEPHRWSIGQCLDHLITTNSTYFKTLDDIIRGDYKPDLWARISPFSNYFGNILTKSLGPERRKSYKSPPVFQPSQSSVPENIIQTFMENNDATINRFRKIQELNLESVVIYSPASNFFTYRVHHALAIIARHEQRHLLQLLEVKSLLSNS